jgi:hypothetical protein
MNLASFDKANFIFLSVEKNDQACILLEFSAELGQHLEINYFLFFKVLHCGTFLLLLV